MPSSRKDLPPPTRTNCRENSDQSLDAYDFLVGTSVDQQTIHRATIIATAWGVSPHDVLLSLSWVTPEDYVSKLAASLQVESAFSENRNQRARTIDATTDMPSCVAAQVKQARQLPSPVCLSSALRPEASLTREQRGHMVFESVNRLRSAMAYASAGTQQSAWQLLVVLATLGALLTTAIIDRALVYFVVTFFAAIPFSFLVTQRLMALLVYWWAPHPKLNRAIIHSRNTRAPEDLPIYTVLVPLFREAEVLPDLLSALTQLNYPAAKLDVILALEECDSETQRAIAGLDRPGFVKVVHVPDLPPRTKPKALNYAMHFARGDFIVVYDAEDIPDPNQLRDALKVFDQHPEIDCLQARLNIYNASENWLTAQFALEYTTLFDGLLPALERMGVPMPLGGTSNHFRRRVLLISNLWDPFNVTEDADLGLRLTRQNRKIGVLNSDTWEEAPAELGNWIPQRTRWLKGWMQTYMVHMRNPRALMQDLGLPAFVGFQCLIGGFLLSVLLHPVFYALVLIELHRAVPFQSGQSYAAQFLWTLAIFNLVVGLLTAICFSVLAALRRRRWQLACTAPLMPVYWLLISFAAYRAVFQLMFAPYRWEKTRHRSRAHSRSLM